jgi:hypothetical protein
VKKTFQTRKLTAWIKRCVVFRSVKYLRMITSAVSGSSGV